MRAALCLVVDRRGERCRRPPWRRVAPGSHFASGQALTPGHQLLTQCPATGSRFAHDSNQATAISALRQSSSTCRNLRRPMRIDTRRSRSVRDYSLNARRVTANAARSCRFLATRADSVCFFGVQIADKQVLACLSCSAQQGTKQGGRSPVSTAGTCRSGLLCGNPRLRRS